MSDLPTTGSNLRRNDGVVGPRPTVILVAVVAAVGLAGFAGWSAHGDALFWSLLQAGLAWCI
ncbi:MAG: hypothetical protein WAU86_05775 [Oricola sp.]